MNRKRFGTFLLKNVTHMPVIKTWHAFEGMFVQVIFINLQINLEWQKIDSSATEWKQY